MALCLLYLMAQRLRLLNNRQFVGVSTPSFSRNGFDGATAVWRGMKALPAPPSVVSSEDTTPAARSLHFLKDDSLLVSYLEHGIVYVGQAWVSTVNLT